MMQGTFLKESIGRDLEAMGTHEALNQASDKVINLLLTILSLLMLTLYWHNMQR